MSAKKLQLNQWLIDLTSGEVATGNQDSSSDSAPKISASRSDSQRKEPQRIEPQGIALLRILAQSPNQVLSKDQLIAAIWQDVIVTDDALSRVVSRVRKVLQESPKQPEILETLPKRGYRLIATDIKWLEDETATQEATTEEPITQETPTQEAKTLEATTQKAEESTEALQQNHQQITANSINERESVEIGHQKSATDTVSQSQSTAPQHSFSSKELLQKEASPKRASQNKSSQNKSSQKWLLAALLVLCLLAVLVLNNPFNGTSEPPITKATDEVESLVKQGDDYYAQIRRQDNEMAIELYKQAMAMRPDFGAARAGLANALVQQVLRWQNPVSEQEAPFAGMFAAIAEGRTQTPEAIQKLKRARDFAEQGIAHSPGDPRTHKALGLVLAAQQEFDAAMQSYQSAVDLNPNAWDSYINMGDIMEQTGNLPLAIEYYIKTFEAMKRVSEEQAVRIRPWHADMGAAVGEKFVKLGDLNEGEVWFRHVLNFAPFNFRATKGLADVLMKTGNADGAVTLCQQFKRRIGENPCENLVDI